MKHLVRFGFALALAATAATPLAAQPGAGPVGGVMQERAARRPFDALLRHRAELELSDAQVRQLETIRERLEQRNAPLRTQLVERTQRWRAERRGQLERMTPEQRRQELRRLRQQPAGRRVPADMQPIVRQMRVNIEAATHEAQGVLTPEQRLRLRELLRSEVRGVRRPGVGGPRHRPGMEGRRPGAERRAREGRQP